MKKIIAPSILSANMFNLEKEVNALKKYGINHLHFDVMDGHFVPNISYGPKILHDLKRGAPEMFVDVHLMISRPDIYWKNFVDAGADLISIHAETLTRLENKNLLKEIKEKGVKTGIALNPETPIEELIPYTGLFDLVVIMSVKPGFGGQKFIETTTLKLEELNAFRKKMELDFKILIDGGINEITSSLVYDYVDIFVAGSYIFNNIYQTSIERILKK